MLDPSLGIQEEHLALLIIDLLACCFLIEIQDVYDSTSLWDRCFGPQDALEKIRVSSIN